MAPEPANTCATCGNVATNKCGSCKAVVYCGKNCQTVHWKMHKATCKEVLLQNALARISVLIQQAYFEFSEQTFDTPIIKTEEQVDGWVIYDGDQQQKANYFVKFPQHLMRTEQMKHAALSAWKCNEPLGFLHHLMAGLLQDFNVKIEEVSITLGSVPRMISVVFPNGVRFNNRPTHGDDHVGLRIKSIKTGKDYLLDVCGAQYGIHQAFWEVSMYEKLFSAKLGKAYPFGTYKHLFSIIKKIQGNPVFAYGVVGDAAEHLNAAIATWETNSGTLLSRVSFQNDVEFEKTKGSILRIVHEATKEFIQKNDFMTLYQAEMKYSKEHPGKDYAQIVQVTREFLDKAYRDVNE